MAIKLKKKPVADVSVTLKTSGEVTGQKHENVLVEPPETQTSSESPGDPAEVEPSGEAVASIPYCEVGFEASYTHNLGNYESARVVVSLKIPCPHAEIDEAFEYAKAWVDAKLNAVNAELTGESN